MSYTITNDQSYKVVYLTKYGFRYPLEPGESVTITDPEQGGGGGSTPLPPYDLGNSLSGTITLDPANGPYQRCSLNGEVTVEMGSGVDGDTVTWVIQFGWNSTIVLGGAINVPQDAIPYSSPITLENWRAYKLEFRHLGGYWQLIEFSSPFLEGLD